MEEDIVQGSEELMAALRQAQGEREAAQGEREAALGERDSALGERDSALGEREAALGERDAVRGELDGLREQVRASAVRYREALAASNPSVPPELIVGESIEALDASLEAARGVVEAVIERAALRQAQGERASEPQGERASENSQAGVPVLQVPGGAPVRSGPDISAMSAVEKIKFGLG